MSNQFKKTEEIIIKFSEEKTVNSSEILQIMSFFNNLGSKLETSPEVLLVRCVRALSKNKLEKADKIIELLLLGNNSQTAYLTWFVSGLRSQEKNDNYKAIEDYKNSVHCSTPSNKIIYYSYIKIIECFILLREFSLAIKFYTSNPLAFVNAELSARVLCNLGFCCEKIGDIARACEFYSRVPQDSGIISTLSRIRESILSRNFEQAESMIITQTGNYKKNGEKWCDLKYMLGCLYVAQGDYKKAVKILEKISSYHSHRIYYLCALGKAFLKSINYSESFLCYLKAAVINREVPEIWFNIALIYNSLGQDEQEKAMVLAKNYDPTGVLPNRTQSVEPVDLVLNLLEFGKNDHCTERTSNIIPMVIEKSKKIKKNSKIVRPVPINGFTVPQAYYPMIPFNLFFGDYMLWKAQESMVKNMEANDIDQAAQTLLKIHELPLKRDRNFN